MRRFATDSVNYGYEVDVIVKDRIYDISKPVLDPTSASGVTVTVTLGNGVSYDGFCSSLFSYINSKGRRIRGEDDYDGDEFNCLREEI